MGNTRKVRITARVGDPSNGAILAPGAVVELPGTWAERYVEQGKAEFVEKAAKAPKPEKKKK